MTAWPVLRVGRRLEYLLKTIRYVGNAAASRKHRLASRHAGVYVAAAAMKKLLAVREHADSTKELCGLPFLS